MPAGPSSSRPSTAALLPVRPGFRPGPAPLLSATHPPPSRLAPACPAVAASCVVATQPPSERTPDSKRRGKPALRSNSTLLSRSQHFQGHCYGFADLITGSAVGGIAPGAFESVEEEVAPLGGVVHHRVRQRPQARVSDLSDGVLWRFVAEEARNRLRNILEVEGHEQRHLALVRDGLHRRKRLGPCHLPADLLGVLDQVHPLLNALNQSSANLDPKLRHSFIQRCLSPRSKLLRADLDLL
mmetsp:Transcript_1966/g.4602  ORF Transcript_1966/g.4602 Transcript_1966/m.4602 type:complete len:241 (+) Transcript_1966:269-991(+)